MSNTLFTQKFRQECLEGSAIDPEQFHAAIDFIEDTGRWEPNYALGHHVRRFWEQQQPHNFEELACFIQEDGTLWQAKPRNPRLDWKKTCKRLERIGWQGDVLHGIVHHPEAASYQKYEFPKGKGSTPYLPPVSGSIRQRIAARYGCDVPLDSSFWDWVAANPDIPIAFTEGGKKALSLLSQGYVAISLVGVNGGYRSKDALSNPVQPYLIPDLKRFCQAGRPMLLAFDQDAEATTRRRVTSALFRFGSLLKAAGGSVKLALWDSAQGKGVDDLIANSGPDAFHHAADQALTLDEYRLMLALDNRLGSIIPALRVNTHDLSSIDVEDIPRTGIIAISSAKGTGKTKAIGGMVTGNDPALLLGHRIALTRNLCERLGIRYRGELDKVKGQFTDGSGYVLRVGGCVDGTLLAINPKDFEGCDLILDEVVQVLRHLLTSSTCNKDGKRPVLLARFTELVRSARRVILADADLDRASIQYIQALRGSNNVPWVLVNDAKADPWPVQFLESPDATAITARLLQDIQTGKRVFVATDSKAGSKKLERLITQTEGIGANVLLLNSETSRGELEKAFITAPDANLKGWDVAIATPSMATGVSIEAQHFDSVYGIFWGASSTDADMAQALARVRQPVPRVVWCAQRGRNFSRIGRDSNPLRLKKLLQDKSNATTQLTAVSLGAVGAELAGYDWLNPHVDLWATIEADRNRSMLALRSALKVRLLHEGHTLTIERMETDDEIRAALRAARNEIAKMEAEAVSNAPDLTATEAKALEKLESLEPEERLALHKWRLADFYCLPLADITPEIVLADQNGQRRSQIRNFEEFLSRDVAIESDRHSIEKQAQWERGVCPWDSAHAVLKHEVRHRLGLNRFLVDGITWTSADLEDFKTQALSMAHQIKGALNITIRASMSGAQILGILLEQIGMKTVSQQYRDGGQRRRRYRIDKQIKADVMATVTRRAERHQDANEQASSSVTYPPVKDISSRVCDTQTFLQNQGFSPADLEDVRRLWGEAAAAGPDALAELQQTIPHDLLTAAIAV